MGCAADRACRKMTRLRILIAVALAINIAECCNPASAEEAAIGNSLLAKCSTALAIAENRTPTPTSGVGPLYDLGYCLGYFDATARQGNGILFCIPPGVTPAQSIRVFIKYANAHPQILHDGAVYILRTAFFEAFPCEK
jgi:hypothetical protein